MSFNNKWALFYKFTVNFNRIVLFHDKNFSFISVKTSLSNSIQILFICLYFNGLEVKDSWLCFLDSLRLPMFPTLVAQQKRVHRGGAPEMASRGQLFCLVSPDEPSAGFHDGVLNSFF